MPVLQMLDQVLAELEIPSADAMEALGGELLPIVQWPKCICFLIGPLGAGKTTLVRGFLRALGYGGTVKSPTYTLVEPYTVDSYRVFHFDLYRLNDPDELEQIGFRDYLDGTSVCFIEWPERAALPLSMADVVIRIDYVESGRILSMMSNRGGAEDLAERLIERMLHAQSAGKH